MRSRGLIEATLVCLIATALTAAATYPVAVRYDQVGRVNTDDGRWSIWVVAWVAHKLTSDPLEVFNANIFHPHRYALAFSEANLGAGFLGAPVWFLTENPYATHNIAFLLSFVIAFAGAYYLVRHLTASRHAAIVSAVLYAFCPFVFARTAHIQLMFTGGLPWSMLAFHRLVDAPSVTRSVVLGVTLWATALSCAYYGIFAGLMVGLGTAVFAAAHGRWRSSDYWVAIGLAAFVSVGLTIPFFLPYLEIQTEMGFARTLDDARMYSADGGAWLASAAWAHRWWLPHLDRFNEVLFPGVTTLVLAVVGIARGVGRKPPVGAAHRPGLSLEAGLLYVLIAVFACWASFGPDGGLYRLFYDYLPIFTFLRAPGRMGIMVTLALTVLAGSAVAYWSSRLARATALTAALAAGAFAELATMPLDQFRQADQVSSAHRLLKTLPRGVVAEFPYWYERMDFPRHAFYMLLSTAHWQPLVNGYSDHIPRDFRESVRSLSSFPSRESFGILARRETRYVLLHLNMYNIRLRERLFERLEAYQDYLRPIVREGDVWLFEIVGWPN
ncbi:MAG: hypothetical protein ACT4QD_20955 [Acidobacteriota bacterium]